MTAFFTKNDFDGMKVYINTDVVLDDGIYIDENLGSVYFQKSLKASGSIIVGPGTNLNIKGNLSSGGSINITDGYLNVTGNIKAARGISAAYDIYSDGEISVGKAYYVSAGLTNYYNHPYKITCSKFTGHVKYGNLVIKKEEAKIFVDEAGKRYKLILLDD